MPTSLGIEVLRPLNGRSYLNTELVVGHPPRYDKGPVEHQVEQEEERMV